MKILNSILQFFKKNPRIIEYIIIFVIIWFAFVMPAKNRLKEEIASREKFEQSMMGNISALKDSVKVQIDKNGNMYSEKLGYAVENIEELKQFDKQLYEELVASDKDLKAFINSEIETVLTKVGETKGSIEQDSDSAFTLKDSYFYSDSGLVHNMKWETPISLKYLETGIFLDKGETTILDNTFNIKLSFETIQTDDGRSKVVARSPSEFVQFNALNSVYIDKNLNTPTETKSRLGVGPTLGIAYSNGKVNPYIGVGLNWNVWTIKRFK